MPGQYFIFFQKIVLVLLTTIFIGCGRNDYDITTLPPVAVYQYLPENLVAVSGDGTVTARYVDPTERYDHGILGDKIEAGGLLVVKQMKSYYYRLDSTHVFEDLRPRLYDVDNDGEIEFVAIRTSLLSGASVCVFKIIDDELQPFLQTGYIGQPYRWLNIAAINDMDDDGFAEIAWVQTPHIGGTLKIARIRDGMIKIIDEKDGVSNHKIGSRNLCLSAMTFSDGIKTLFIPNDGHNAVIGFTFRDDRLIRQDSLPLIIDVSVPLGMQLDFQDLLTDENCIHVPAF